MQTFIVTKEMDRNAEILDRSRLGKQRVEAIQIARTLLGLSNGWENHPAVKMWRGYESFLVKIYLKSIMNEWIKRGYNNDKCGKHYLQLLECIKSSEPIVPNWFSEDFFRSHQSNLLRKNKDHYSKYFSDVPDNLEYIWPK